MSPHPASDAMGWDRDPVLLAVYGALTEGGRDPGSLLNSEPVGGGCINSCRRLDFENGTYFLKQNHADRYPGMFAAEAAGLDLLAGAAGNASTKSSTTDGLRVPAVMANGTGGDQAWLLLEHLKTDREGGGGSAFWERFGRGLARLHDCTAAAYGLSTDNWIGSLPQANGSMDDWPGFYRTRRLEPQLGRARSAGLIRGNLSKACDALLDRLEDFFPQSGDRPALLHGDLWSGNYLVGPNREPCLVDPAVYYGHPAIDLAMTRLFGGFDTYFYSAYRELRPERPGDAEREELCRLYPLLVHVNLFGAGYVSSVEGIVRRFV